ncbi:glucose/sorbosone dehydrogenase, partial [Shigella dysenteriae]|uniref:PQQ-dependent sugar dehydrogenase n=1 Tax=Shigella dysenteriae TaxID=622 RepID=UPI000E5D7E70
GCLKKEQMVVSAIASTPQLFIGALKDKDVIVMSVNGDKVTEDGRILTDRGQRIRDVRTGPDGYLYVLTDESSGELLKVSPRN